MKLSKADAEIVEDALVAHIHDLKGWRDEKQDFGEETDADDAEITACEDLLRRIKEITSQAKEN